MDLAGQFFIALYATTTVKDPETGDRVSLLKVGGLQKKTYSLLLIEL